MLCEEWQPAPLVPEVDEEDQRPDPPIITRCGQLGQTHCTLSGYVELLMTASNAASNAAAACTNDPAGVLPAQFIMPSVCLLTGLAQVADAVCPWGGAAPWASAPWSGSGLTRVVMCCCCCCYFRLGAAFDVTVGGHPALNLTSSDFLGLGNDPVVQVRSSFAAALCALSSCACSWQPYTRYAVPR
jgi:hypothetical protein